MSFMPRICCIPISDKIEVSSIEEVTVKDIEFTAIGRELTFSWKTVGLESYEQVIHHVRL